MCQTGFVNKSPLKLKGLVSDGHSWRVCPCHLQALRLLGYFLLDCELQAISVSKLCLHLDKPVPLMGGINHKKKEPACIKLFFIVLF